jgi:MFS family permease
MVAYGAIGVLAGLTGGLGNALVTTNLAYFQGTLGLSAQQAAWFPAAFVSANVCANLILVKFRQQFGLQLFVWTVLVGYALATFLHLISHDFWSSLLVRAASGLAAAGLTTLGALMMMQAMPPPLRIGGLMVGVSLPQLAAPVARVIAPSLLETGDWRMAYTFELGLALLTLSAVLALPLPPSERSDSFEPTDFATMALLFPGIALLCSVLSLGRTVWWTSAQWIGWASIGAIVLITLAGLIEHRRANPLLTFRFLGQRTILRLIAIAFFMRMLVAEQTFASVGLMSALGVGTDQLQSLFVVVTIASVAGLVVSLVTFRPEFPARGIQVACLLIVTAAILDSGATNLARPANLYVTQSLVGFASLLFVGPAMAIGLSRVMLAGQQYFISWIVVYVATQNLGNLAGPAFFGSIETIREKFHSHQLVDHLSLSSPLTSARISANSQQVSGMISDPALRSAVGGALLGQQSTREANVLAFNDVFVIIAFLASLVLLWGISIELKMRRTGELSPLVRLAQTLAVRAAAHETGDRTS